MLQKGGFIDFYRTSQALINDLGGLQSLTLGAHQPLMK